MVRHEAALASSANPRSPGGQPTYRKSLCLGGAARSQRLEVRAGGQSYELTALRRWLDIDDGKLHEFKRPAAQCAALARMKDTGTLEDELYFNSANTASLVFERYRHSQALLDHHTHLGDTHRRDAKACSGSEQSAARRARNCLSSSKDVPVQVVYIIAGTEGDSGGCRCSLSRGPASQSWKPTFPDAAGCCMLGLSACSLRA